MKIFLIISILIHFLLIVSISFFLSSDRVAKKDYELSYVSVKEFSPPVNKKSDNNIQNKISKPVAKRNVKAGQQKKKAVSKNKALKSIFADNSLEIKKQKITNKNGLKEANSSNSSFKTEKNPEVNQKSFVFPSYKFSPKPEYPIIAKKRGYEGEVVIDVYVLENGSVGKLKLLKASGFKVLDESAITAVKKWEFIPAKNKGVSVSTWVKVPISFKLISG